MIKIISFGILLALASCAKPKYQYIEIVKSPKFGNLTEKDPVIIEIKTDSAAFLKAYSKFYISETVILKANENYGIALDVPVAFKLLRPDGTEVPQEIEFLKKDSLMSVAREKIDYLQNRPLRRRVEKLQYESTRLKTKFSR